MKPSSSWDTAPGAHGTIHRNGRSTAPVGESVVDGRNRRTVWTIAPQPFPEAHHATMPVRLAADCIRIGCPVGGMVLDPFGGSGTTALAANANDRNALLIELNPEYAAMARRRLEDELGMLARVEYEVSSP